MTTLDELRTTLFAAAKEACRVKAREVGAKTPGASLPSEAAIEAFADWISTSAGPVANACLKLSTDALVPGASHLVGMPDMPASMEWPHHNGRPLAFLAQIDLTSLPRECDWPVPRKGWLCFFLGAAEEAAITVGNPDAWPHRTIYFACDVSELRPRQAPEGTIMPDQFSKAVPYSVSFELGLSALIDVFDMSAFGQGRGADLPWERHPALKSLGRLEELDYGPALQERDDRLFGLPRHTQTVDARFMAAATAAGYGKVINLAGWSMERFEREVTPGGPGWVSHPEVARLFREMKARQSWLEEEARHWRSLFSLGCHLHGSTGRGDGTWHFLWWDGDRFHVSIDERKARRGDFSGTFIHVSDV